MVTSTASESHALIRGASLGVVGLTGLATAVLSPQWRGLGIAIALVCFLLAGSVLSRAARIAGILTPLVGKLVRVEVWGQPIEAAGALEVQSVRAIGAGLHIFLRSPLERSSRDLKIAQPRDARLTDTQLTIERAAYISLAGTKLARSGARPALRMCWPAV